MRIVLQRVSKSSVSIDGKKYSAIGKGLMVLVGIREGDTQDDVDWLVAKTGNLRIFDDSSGVMNLSVIDIDGEILAVSQFTLSASTKKGNRPSYIMAAKHETAIPLYEAYCRKLGELTGKEVKTGKFGADMKVELINDGPVTIIIDSHLKE